jgi:hypothetical protein
MIATLRQRGRVYVPKWNVLLYGLTFHAPNVCAVFWSRPINITSPHAYILKYRRKIHLPSATATPFNTNPNHPVNDDLFVESILAVLPPFSTRWLFRVVRGFS